jgi:hypothetical protein
VTRAAAALVACALAGCITPSPPAEPDLARPAVAPPPPPVAAAPKGPVMAEVEMGGIITLPPHVKGDVTVWVVDRPCWQPGARAFGSTKMAVGKFFFEVYVPQGSELWICAAVGDGSKPLEIYGQAERAPLLGKGVGEVPFMGIEVKLARGKKVAAPVKR